MEQTQNIWQFASQQSDKLWSQTWSHIGLTMISLILAILVAVPLGIVISRKKKLAGAVLGIAGIMQTIPSIAMLGVMIPIFGIGPKPAILALFLYALLPVLRNTFTGISEVNPTVVDAAKGMGMGRWDILMKVELPLAFPVLMAGIRTAAVINVGVATLAAYVAAGGLGEFIFGGIALNNSNMILAGAIPAACLAILLDFILSRAQRIRLKSVRLLYLVLPLILISLCSFYLLPGRLGGKMLAGFTPEFMGREDGYLGLKRVYRMAIDPVVISDAVMYKAALEKKLDVISGYSTDGRLQAYGLVTLRDDRHIFPPYFAAPLVRQDVLKRYPELEPALNQLSGTINDSVMTSLNYKVDHLKQSPERVALDFMVEHQLYKPARGGSKGVIRIGSKIFGEQYILAQMYKILISGNTDLSVQTKTGLGGTKICFDALNNNQIDFYPEYTGTGFLVLLKPDEMTVNKLIGSKEAVYNYVQREFLQRYHLNWLRPIGFNNTYALMMRKEQADRLNIKSISDLTRYVNHPKN
jgi:osmoprotectant transport system permease protein